MSLEEEIKINQFGQGVHSQVELLEHFSQLDEGQKSQQVFALMALVEQFDLEDAEIEQLFFDGSLAPTSSPFAILKVNRMKKGIQINFAKGELEKSYKLLLDLFKRAVDRLFESDQKNPAAWQYWDLSSREVVQSILTNYQALVDDVYANPSFRSEFVSLAKLWHEHISLREARYQEPAPEQQTQFDFIGYDAMVNESIKLVDDMFSRPRRLLFHAVEKALSKQYGVEANRAGKVVLDVIARHLRETYNTGLY